MTLQECKKNIGRYVTYIPFDGCDKSLYERGIITNINKKYAFVRYGNDCASKSTNPNDLILG